MKRLFIWVFLAFQVGLVTLAACSSSSTSESLVPPDANPNACAEPGAVGNELGVGEFCTRLGGECNDNEEALFCTADHHEGAAFCTKSCASAEQCGGGAVCVAETEGGPKGCVPSCFLD